MSGYKKSTGLSRTKENLTTLGKNISKALFPTTTKIVKTISSKFNKNDEQTKKEGGVTLKSPIYNYNNFSSYNVKSGGSKNAPEGFSMRSGNKPSIAQLSGVSPLKDNPIAEGAAEAISEAVTRKNLVLGESGKGTKRKSTPSMNPNDPDRPGSSGMYPTGFETKIPRLNLRKL